MKNTILTLVLAFVTSFTVFASEPNNVLGTPETELIPEGIKVSWEETTNLDETAVDHYRVHIDTHSVPDAEIYADVQVTSDNNTEYIITNFKGEELIDGLEYFISITAINAENEESLSYSAETSVVFAVVEEEEELTIESLEEIDSEQEEAVSESEEVSEFPEELEATESEENFHEIPFFEKEEKVEDTTPPEDVTDLYATYAVLNADNNSYSVKLNWNASKDSAKDLDHQKYYKKSGGDNFQTALKIDKEKTAYQAVLAGGERYTFKISTVDTSGNESLGSITSIVLPETGPAALLGLLGMFSAGAAHLVRRKK